MDILPIIYKSNLDTKQNSQRNNPNNMDISLEKIYDVFANFKNNYLCEEIPPDFFLKKSKKIYYFKIVKYKKRGKRRLKSNSKLHDKNSRYNIICKIKVYFIKSLLEQANKLYNKNIEEDKMQQEQFLLPINQKEEKEKKNINVDWFFKTAKEYLSSNISGKYYAHEKDYNKKRIDDVYKENERKDLINFLDQNINIIYQEYISAEPSKNVIFKDMKKISTDLDYMKLKYGYDDNYIKKVKGISENLNEIFKAKIIK